MNRSLLTLAQINSLTRRPLPPFLKRSFHRARRPNPRYDELRHRKWGWTVYRTAYNNNDAQWNRFKHLITQYPALRIRAAYQRYPEGIADNLEWTFIDDRTTFNGASRDFLRQHYNQLGKPLGRVPNPVFFQADEEALQSVMEYFDEDWEFDQGLDGFINMIYAPWIPQHQGLSPEDSPCDPQDDEKYKEIDGYTEYDVGWMKVTADLIGPRLYLDFTQFRWPHRYVRPPDIYPY